MNTLEDRLRAALTAKSDGVALSMLTRSLPPLDDGEEPDAAPLITLPATRPHHPRRIVAAALAVAAVLLVAFGAVALHRATSDKTLGPAHVRPRSAIPWNKVGVGWQIELVASDGRLIQSDPKVPFTNLPTTMYVVDPAGQTWYRICQLDGMNIQSTNWARNTGTAYLIQTAASGSRILAVDLHAGTVHSFVVPGAWGSVQPVDPAGRTLLLANPWTSMMTVSSTGQPLVRIPSTRYAATQLSPNGAEVAAGGQTMLTVLETATGRVLDTMPAPAGYEFCFPLYWDSAVNVVASCQQRTTHHLQRRFQFSTASHAGPVALPFPIGSAQLQLTPDITAVSHQVLSRYPITEPGRPGTFSVPAQLHQGNWTISVTLEGDLLAYLWESPGSDILASLVRWNPGTGKVEDLVANRPPGSYVLRYAAWDPARY